MTGNNNELTVYLDEPTSNQLLAYQEKRELTKSKAGAEMIKAGLQKEFGGLGDSFFWELAKMAVYVGLTITLVWWWSGVGSLPVAVYLAPLSYIFVTMAVLSLVIHLSDFNPLAFLSRSPDEHQA